MVHATFPHTRLRRTRAHDWLRRLVAEHQLTAHDLIWPTFVQEGNGLSTPIAAMPGVERLTVDRLLPQVERAVRLGIPAIALFPSINPALKDEQGSEAFNPENLVCRTLRAIKQRFGNDIGVITDVALDPYTSHGHDGIVRNHDVDNDLTVTALCKQAVIQAAAGSDVVAPSDMMDGRIGAIRQTLEQEGFTHTTILSYAVKYASVFYGPFRQAVGSAAQLGKSNKRSYQMDPANAEEAFREVAMDIAEGADMLMVKPGMAYLDIIYRLKQQFPVPILAYQVSGEYAMLKSSSDNALPAFLESLLAFKRAGASGVFTYAALEVAEYLKQGDVL